MSLLSKHLIQFRGGHIFNPSNFGLVLCFLLLGPELADPLEFWWGPMSFWLALALAIIVGGGFAILRRLRLLCDRGRRSGSRSPPAIAVLAASGHDMTARWHLGPVSDWHFWRVLAFSPEILVFLFFMITDPKTIPAGKAGRRVYAVAIGLLAALLIAPQTTEFGDEGRAARPRSRSSAPRGRSSIAGPPLHCGGATGRPAPSARPRSPVRSRSSACSSSPGSPPARARRRAVLPAPAGRASGRQRPDGGGDRADRPRTAERIALDLVADLENEAEALRRRDRERATAGADGARLAGLWRQIDAAGRRHAASRATRSTRVRVSLEPADGQSPPLVVATRSGTVERGGTTKLFAETFELVLEGRPLPDHRDARIAPAAGAAPDRALGRPRRRPAARTSPRRSGSTSGTRAFRFGMTHEAAPMMGGGLCWLDYDDDGWLDLFVVNAYGDDDYVRWTERGGLPRSALFHNVGGRFEDVSRGSGADLQLRGSGCVAADFNEDGKTDLFVTTAGYNAATDGYDALLWNNGDGTFTEGARGGRDQRAGLARGRRRRRRRTATAAPTSSSRATPT